MILLYFVQNFSLSACYDQNGIKRLHTDSLDSVHQIGCCAVDPDSLEFKLAQVTFVSSSLQKLKRVYQTINNSLMVLMPQC